MEDFVTVDEATQLTKLSRATIYRMVEAGKLTPYKFGGGKRTFFRRSDLEALYQPVTNEEFSPKRERPAA